QKPMAAIVHDVVGLLHSCMAIYYAYIDRAPVLILGATGPMNEAKRRPRIDWIHTANVQGNAVREYTKWDDQPSSIEGVPSSFARAYRVALPEALSIPVVDVRPRHNFPTNHPLNMTHTDVLEEADLLLALDVRDLERPTTRLESTTREVQSRLPTDCVFADIGFSDLELSSWSMDYGRYQETTLSILADTALAGPALADLVSERVAASG